MKTTTTTCAMKLLELRGFLTIKEIVDRTGYDKSMVCKAVNSGFYPSTMIKVGRRYEKLVAMYPYLKGKPFPLELWESYKQGGYETVEVVDSGRPIDKECDK